MYQKLPSIKHFDYKAAMMNIQTYPNNQGANTIAYYKRLSF